MKDGVPIDFASGEQSPEIAEIEIAIKEADDWIEADREDIESIQLQIEVAQNMVTYATENKLSSSEVTIPDLTIKLTRAQENLQKDIALREEFVGLKGNFHQLDWRKELQEIEIKHLMKNDNFPKPVD